MATDPVIDEHPISSFSELQAVTGVWRQKNFSADKRDAMHQALGVCEEAGELAHSVLKLSQGIRGDRAHHVDQATDAVGDIVIFLCGLCDALGISFFEAVNRAWSEVMKRDWVENTTDGTES